MISFILFEIKLYVFLIFVIIKTTLQYFIDIITIINILILKVKYLSLYIY